MNQHDLTQRPSISPMLRPASLWIAMLLLVASAMATAYLWSERNGFVQVDDVANRQLDLYASTLESELGKHAYLPSLIEVDEDVIALCQGATDPVLKQTVNRKLASFNVRASAITLFLIDPAGDVLASSDWFRGATAFSQQQFSRSFFTQALRGEKSDFFAANAVNGASEYFFTQPLRRNDRFLGAIGVRISLDPLEATWVDLGIRSESEKIMVIDDNDVVIMSSLPMWKFRSVKPMSPEQSLKLAAIGKYPPAAVKLLDLSVDRMIEPGVALVRISEAVNSAPVLRIAHERSMVQLGWRLMLVSDPTEVWRNARYAAWGGGAFSAFLCVLLLYFLQRRRALAHMLVARNALQQANDQLEIKVTQRTSELSTANRDLLHEIHERKLAEEELVQAGKLAVLGQMSAGVSHEINQPLTALRALSQNTAILFKQGRTQEMLANLKAIGDVAERMGRITAQLKSFARKTQLHRHEVSLLTAVANVQTLLEHRTRSEQIEVVIDVAASPLVNCDMNRLEQVLINLATNALDAMADASIKRLSISAAPRDGRMVVRVADTGPGVSDAVLKRLFEPFFSTKPAGEGLGLGLVISSNIIREMGSSLRVERGEVGLIFEFDLELWREVTDV